MKKYEFDVAKVTEQLVEWIRVFFEENGPGCKAVLGISGGKDSSVTAALCVKALGKDRVVGVLMPNGEQADIDMAKLLVSHLGIANIEVNIKAAVDGVFAGIEAGVKKNHESESGRGDAQSLEAGSGRGDAKRPVAESGRGDAQSLEADQGLSVEITSQTKTNLPPRIRMATVYAISQSLNGRVVNTCNLSEDWVGYSTRYGDAAGDFSPLAKLTVAEVKAVGTYLGLPDVLVDKVPIDGLCGKTDEDNLGFSYAVLDRYIREGICEDAQIKAKIDGMHRRNLFKMIGMPMFDPVIETVEKLPY